MEDREKQVELEINSNNQTKVDENIFYEIPSEPIIIPDNTSNVEVLDEKENDREELNQKLENFYEQVNEEEEKEEKQERKRKRIILLILLLLILLMIIFGLTYSLFSYTKKGDTDNTITSGKLEFLYTENTGLGNGISITNALPVDDTTGKNYSTDKYVFDFKVTAKIQDNVTIPYEITARQGKNSTLSGDVVKIYLVEKEGELENAAPLTIDSLGVVKRFNELNNTSINVGTHSDGSQIIEKTIYKGVASGENYDQDFRLRMWVAEDTDFSDGGYNNKSFIVTVNVYAEVES